VLNKAFLLVSMMLIAALLLPAPALAKRKKNKEAPPPPTADERAAAVIDEHVALYRPLYLEFSDAFWAAMTTGSEENFAKIEEVQLRINAVRGDGPRFAATRELLADPGLTDELLRRQLVMLEMEYLPQQIPEDARQRITEIEVELDRIFTNYRMELGGGQQSMAYVETLMVTSEDGAALEEAWKASKGVAPQLLPLHQELVALRNGAAREMGYADYYELALRARGYDPAWLEAFFAEVDEATAAPFAELKGTEIDPMLAERFGVPAAELMPWHYGNPYFQDIPTGLLALDLDPLFARRDYEQVVADARDFFGGIGLPADTILANSDLYPREGKNPHAMAHMMDLEQRGTSRLLMNLPLPPGTQNRRETATLAHELGHCVHYEGVDQSLPYLFHDVISQNTEALAMLMERQIVSTGWLEGYLGVEHDEAVELSARAAAITRAQELIFTRWCLVIYHWERDIYANPDQDWGEVWWTYKQRFQLLNKPEGWSNPDALAKYHLASADAGGYSSYAVGGFIASQLAVALADEIGEDVRAASYRGRPEVGAWLTERYFAPGARYDWLELVELATGKPLSTEHWKAQFIQEIPEG